jgi:hypothetical protein
VGSEGYWGGCDSESDRCVLSFLFLSFFPSLTLPFPLQPNSKSSALKRKLLSLPDLAPPSPSPRPQRPPPPLLGVEMTAEHGIEMTGIEGTSERGSGSGIGQEEERRRRVVGIGM